MKLRSTFGVALIFFSGISSGQSFKAGLLGGITTSQVDGDHLSGFHKAGIKAGGFVRRQISARSSLQFEIEFIQKGSQLPVNDDGVFYRMRLNYMEVPLLYQFSLGKKWNLEAGFAFATLLSAKEEDQFGEITTAPPFHRYDYLVCAGGNYAITNHLLLNLRYTYSVTSIRPKNEHYNYFYFTGGQYNKVVACALSWQF